ncbi:MAG: hypothetical protein EOP45_03645 [Sphingobacteriaceae bacterium]|nr:MAG: hypothetical protein EOP45_03645 [Sphingobacteriaceae bacterium]
MKELGRKERYFWWIAIETLLLLLSKCPSCSHLLSRIADDNAKRPGDDKLKPEIEALLAGK